MSKWKITALVDEPEDYSANEVLDLVRWAFEDDVNTRDMKLLALTIEAGENPIEALARISCETRHGFRARTEANERAIRLPRRAQRATDPSTGIQHYAGVEG